MERKGIRHVCWMAVLCLSGWFAPVQAAETADEIMAMMAWWDEYGSYWDEADALIEFAGDAPVYVLAENTVTVEASE
jgi:hypothetical protein